LHAPANQRACLSARHGVRVGMHTKATEKVQRA
jgi:hypothetical protein